MSGCIKSGDKGPVIASAAKQSSNKCTMPGSPRRFTPRDDVKIVIASAAKQSSPAIAGYHTNFSILDLAPQ